jgi:iron complex transport system substrate-binding protein
MAVSEKILNTKDTKDTKIRTTPSPAPFAVAGLRPGLRRMKTSRQNESAHSTDSFFARSSSGAARSAAANRAVFVIFVAFVLIGAAAQPQPRRIVSLVPALTEMLFAIGAGPAVVGVSSYDQFPPEVKTLPRVGALLDPDTERILSLKPDLVVTYGSQVDLQMQMKRAAVPTFDYRHGGLDHLLVTLRGLGQRTGRAAEAHKVAAAIQSRIDAIKSSVSGKPRPRTLLVFSRDPRALRNVYVSGGVGFLHDMLVIAGGQGVFADVKRESVQATTETILARAPEVILELRADEMSGKELEDEMAAWSRLAAVPAVKNKRIHFITGGQMTVPGPRVADGIERMVEALHRPVQ